MRTQKKYLLKAKKLFSANFRMYGVGNFDLYTSDVAEILEALEKNDYKKLLSIYERLEKERLD